MDRLSLKLCDLQGRLFENSADAGYESESFLCAFMSSALAADLDSTYNRMQWDGEEYWLEELAAETNLPAGGQIYPKEVLFWTGYVYRYWHFYTGESSEEILRSASPSTMWSNYLIFHTFDPALAVDEWKEIAAQRKDSRGEA